MTKDKPTPKPPKQTPEEWATDFIIRTAGKPKEAIIELANLKAALRTQGQLPRKPKKARPPRVDADGKPVWTRTESNRYGVLCRKPLAVLFKAADQLKLTDAEVGKLTRAFYTAIDNRMQAGDVCHPFLDTCITEALAAANGAGPIMPQPPPKLGPISFNQVKGRDAYIDGPSVGGGYAIWTQAVNEGEWEYLWPNGQWKSVMPALYPTKQAAVDTINKYADKGPPNAPVMP